MCLLSIAFHVHPDLPVVFVGNRDEYHARAAAPADWWADNPDILAGRDLVAGGTWLGINRQGRLAVVTNRPDLPPPEINARSRGELVTSWLQNDDPWPDLETTHSAYGGFSLLLADLQQLKLYSGGNGTGKLLSRNIGQTVTGLSNTEPDQPWPKLTWLNQQVAELLSAAEPDPEALLQLLARTEPVPDAVSHGVPATPFVRGDSYGTRCSTVILLRRDGECLFTERRFGPDGGETGVEIYRFTVGQPG